MTTLNERIEAGMVTQNRCDLLTLNARIAATKDVIELLRKMGTNMMRPTDAAAIVEEHLEHDVADRDALLSSIEDQRIAEFLADGSQIADDLLDDVQAVPREAAQDGFDSQLTGTPVVSKDPSLVISPATFMTSRRDVEDGGHFDPDFGG